jgi:xanthine/uracil/vitamin C permease (AzgA family)
MNIKRIGFVTGAIVLGLVIVTGVAVITGSNGSSPEQQTFADSVHQHFADVQTSIPELKDVTCIDSSCTGGVYFNFATTTPSDLETVIRGNASTYSKFEMDNKQGSHVTVIARIGEATISVISVSVSVG